MGSRRCASPASPLRLALAAVAGVWLGACPDDLPQLRLCPDRPCAVANRCAQQDCQGERWVCLASAAGEPQWVRNGPPCAADLGPPSPDAAPVDAADLRVPDMLPLSCGPHAEPTTSGCACSQGYVNPDGAWGNGCEADDPQCAADHCDHCPEGYCGANARCNDQHKCRCISRFWKDADLDLSNGCETPVEDCSETNCNACYVGFCGPEADCLQNKCGCDTSGYTNCNGIWENDGCECEGTCVAGQCE